MNDTEVLLNNLSNFPTLSKFFEKEWLLSDLNNSPRHPLVSLLLWQKPDPEEIQKLLEQLKEVTDPAAKRARYFPIIRECKI